MNLKIVISLLLITFFFQSCVIVKELIPKAPTESFRMEKINKYSDAFMDPSEIGVEYFYIKGSNEKHTPPNIEPTKNLKSFLMETEGVVDLNRSGVVRYYNVKDKKKPSRIIIMIPGIYSGAGTLSNLSYSLKKRLKNTEIWIWERRSNQLEDRRIILKAIEENNPSLLTNLYEKNTYKLKDKNKAFYQPSTEDISFLGYWGINVMLEDLYYVIKEAKTRSDEIVLAGYSLGVLYATMFLANDFLMDGEKHPGYKLIDKVMLLDGPPMLDGYIYDEYTYDNGATIIPYNVIEGRLKLESGKYYPACATVDRDMSLFFNINVKAALAMLDPYGLSIEPYDTGAKKLPIDNLSKFLISFDDNYADFKLFTATFGKADAKHFGTFSYTTSVKVIDVAEGENKIKWLPRQKDDKVEFNDYKDYLKAELDKKFNMEDWYQPTRILIDMGSIHHNDTTAGWQKKYFNLTENKNIHLPFLCVGLSRGLSTQINIYLDYKKIINPEEYTIIMINDITHLDGDTITDTESRPVIADVAANWLDKKDLVESGLPDYNKAFYYKKGSK